LLGISFQMVSQNSKKAVYNKDIAVKVPMITSEMVIDGKPNDESWENATTYSFNNFYLDQKPDDKQNTKFKMLWSYEYLYFYFECEDKYITAREKTRDGQPYYDDCAEIFLIPTADKINMHFGFELNLYKTPNDFVFLYNYYKNDKVVVKGYNPDYEVEVTVDGTVNDNSDIDKKWTMEMAIPLKAFKLVGNTSPIKIGTKWNFMPLRQDRNDAKGERRTTSTMYPLIDKEKEDVHYPKSFGLIEFVKE